MTGEILMPLKMEVVVEDREVLEVMEMQLKAEMEESELQIP
jgi:hypothetical protein